MEDQETSARGTGDGAGLKKGRKLRAVMLLALLVPLGLFALWIVLYLSRDFARQAPAGADAPQRGALEARLRADVGEPILDARMCHEEAPTDTRCYSYAYGANGHGYSYAPCWGPDCSKSSYVPGVTLTETSSLDAQTLALTQRLRDDYKLDKITCSLKSGSVYEGACDGVPFEKAVPLLGEIFHIEYSCDRQGACRFTPSPNDVLPKDIGGPV